MTYGDFAWNDLLRKSDGETPRRQRTVTPFIEGDPVPYLEYGEDDWAWRVSRVIKKQLTKPRLELILDINGPRRRPFGIDDYGRPLLDVLTRHPNSVWLSIEESDRPGVRVRDVAPSFPPRIHRVATLPYLPREGTHETVKAARRIEQITGNGPVGVYLTFGRIDIGELGFGGAVRGVLDSLSHPLGGDVDHPGKMRVRDLRVARDSGVVNEVEVRLWAMDR